MALSIKNKFNVKVLFKKLISHKKQYNLNYIVSLSHEITNNIYKKRALCDIGATGKLNCEQFALAMHFINKKLATGLDPPQELLPEMVPPSLRPKPIVTEEAHASKEFEELQTQVTELQREKLFYEQRATENEMLTRQKRTELTNLELEMESVFKTLQEREMKRSEEQKRLSDYEERLTKVCHHHIFGWVENENSKTPLFYSNSLCTC